MKNRVGCFHCDCGSNMQQLWTPSKVTEEASKMQGVVFAYNHKYMCSDPDRIPSNRPLRNIAWSKS